MIDGHEEGWETGRKRRWMRFWKGWVDGTVCRKNLHKKRRQVECPKVQGEKRGRSVGWDGAPGHLYILSKGRKREGKQGGKKVDSSLSGE